MAFWRRRGLGGAVYVYTFRSGKQETLPRSETAHLDKQEDTNINYWVDLWASRHEDPKLSFASVVADTALNRYIEDFCTFCEGRGKNKITVSQHRRYLSRDAIPYFLEQGLTSPLDWPSRSWSMHDHLVRLKRSPDQIGAATTSLRLFWKWLGESRTVAPCAALQLPLLNAIIPKKGTPSDRPVTPTEALDYLRHHPHPHVRMLGLIGYFFSLRPHELVALRRCDFAAGPKAMVTEAAQVMAKVGLYNRLVVNVHRQLDGAGKVETLPKAESAGLVACFNKEAAELIVNELRPLKPDELVFDDIRPDSTFKRWRKLGSHWGETKDLRRTSLYWLGHYGGMEFSQLKSHARHETSEATMKYLRRPGEVLEIDDDLNLGA